MANFLHSSPPVSCSVFRRCHQNKLGQKKSELSQEMNKTIPHSGARSWANLILDLLLPRHCVACGQFSGNSNLCPACEAELPRILSGCRQCGLRFAPEQDDFRCTRCGEADVDMVEGNDIVLTSVTCSQEETDET